MNKYIRTKDGRILEWEKLNELTKLSIDICEETIKEADTIEELFDLIVIDFNDDAKKPRRWILSNSKHSLDVAKEFKGSTATVYGAIWTEKGLIYVAKLKRILPNNKIDWELL